MEFSGDRPCASSRRSVDRPALAIGMRQEFLNSLFLPGDAIDHR
jgi:hypothetical protein